MFSTCLVYLALFKDHMIDTMYYLNNFSLYYNIYFVLALVLPLISL